MYRVIRKIGVVAPSHLIVRPEAAEKYRIIMWGCRRMPNESETVMPSHIPGVKKPSGPGSVRRSGRSAATRRQSSTGPPKSLSANTRAPTQIATYIHTPCNTSVQ